MASLLLLGAFGALPSSAQDDATTQNGSSGYNGAFITGPASNPLSFLNGPAFRTTGEKTPYDFADFAPMTALDQQLPSWIGFGLEERFRAEGMENQSFKANDNDNYLLNRWRFLMQIKPTSWLRIVGQMQDARAWLQQPATAAAEHQSLRSQAGLRRVWRPRSIIGSACASAAS